MKHLIACTAFAVLACSTPTLAAPSGFYVGADYLYSTVGHTNGSTFSLGNGLGGEDIHAGYRLNDYLSAEIGVARQHGDDPAHGTTATMQTVSVDGFLSYPVTPTFRVFLAPGFDYRKQDFGKIAAFSPRITNSFTHAINWNARIGTGFDVDLVWGVTFRGEERYETPSGGLKGIDGASLTTLAGFNITL